MARADKQDLREELLQERRALTAEDIESARAAIRSSVLDRWDDARWKSIAAYVPLRTEPRSLQLLDELASRGVKLLVPVTLDDRDLDWVEIPGDVPLGPDVIASVDAVLAPALAVAHDGMRLGRGSGSYDRALRRVRPRIPIAALVYDSEVLHRLPSDEWDVRVTAYVTPSGGWTDI